ncbi:O-acetyltransferase OatA [Corynebacterium atrinae]|uniref:acyltransferase family protein n=1 Tax=Corynebacterium atrinae TaxID=1336740 RepID=UPI0025B46C66|nr:acyltransferase [Corynebacterium atrinae]WJY64512.1 O-acetyltransferase OatA [Corynebacterium atrinae]
MVNPPTQPNRLQGSQPDISPSYKSGHIPALEGLRAVAALGILLTHVAFQTGVDPASTVGSILARFDFFVAVFFFLSAFLLWRRHHADRTGPEIGRYLWKRAGRILPGYLFCVVAVIVLLPEASRMSWSQILANLTLTQVYVPDALAPGLTHLWSLSVEVGFYLALPLLALLIGGFPRKVRILLILGAALLSLGWAYLPFVASTPADGVANRQIWPPGFALWFALGLLAAEIEGRVPRRVERLLRVRWPWWIAAILVAWVAGQPWFGPVGLTHPEPGEFVLRVLAGAVFAAVIVGPVALAPSEKGWLCSAPMQALGRWSYSIFLWHVAMLSVAFPLLGIGPFQGATVQVLVLTVALSIPVAAASYVFVEEPGNRLARAAAHRSATTSESPA